MFSASGTVVTLRGGRMNNSRGIWRGKLIDEDEQIDRNEWVEGFLAKRTKSYAKIVDDEDMVHFVDPQTLGECTCVPDMKGKLIFEGDICTVATSNIADDEYGVVKYDEDEAVFIIDLGTYTINFCDNINGSSVEVVGNIFDNSNYLERR